jgi:hypothetical protein
MKKPLLVRLIGWAGWGFAFLLGIVLYAVYTGPPKPEWAVGMVLFGAGMFVCWVIWGIASGVVWVVRKQAATTAAIVRDAGKMSAPLDMPLRPTPTYRFFCVTHQVWIQLSGLAVHDRVECLYVPDLPSRHVKPAAPEHKTPVVTSPLGLNTLK